MATSLELTAQRNELLVEIDANAARLRTLRDTRAAAALHGARQVTKVYGDIQQVEQHSEALTLAVAELETQIAAAQAEEVAQAKRDALARLDVLTARKQALSDEMVQCLAGHGERSRVEIMRDAYALNAERFATVEGAGIHEQFDRAVLFEPAWSMSDPHGRRARLPYSVCREQAL